MQTLLSKLTSRKFWVALLGIAASVIGSMTSTNATVQLVLTIAGALTTIVWLIIEGRCDWTSIQAAATATVTAVQTYQNTTTDTASTGTSTSTDATTSDTLSSLLTADNIAKVLSIISAVQAATSATTAAAINTDTEETSNGN